MKERLLRILRSAPAVLFGLAFLFCEEPVTAIQTLCAVALHECGHLLAFSRLREPSPLFGAAAGGFRFCAVRPLSYRREALTAAAGPCANLLAAAILFLLARVGGEYFFLSAWIQLLTGLGNLLPVSDLDGGRILHCLLALVCDDRRAKLIADAVSVLTASTGLFVSLSVLSLTGAGFYSSLFFLLLLLTLP